MRILCAKYQTKTANVIPTEASYDLSKWRAGHNLRRPTGKKMEENWPG